MPNNKRMIERGWQGFERLVLPPDASGAQRRDMRRAFFCGASLLFYGILTQASGGPVDEVTEEDLHMMDGVQQEIDEFGEELDAAVLDAMKMGGRGH